MRHARDHVSSRGLSTLLDGELELLEAREARIHIVRCVECRDRLEEIEEIDCRIVLAGREGRPRPGLEAGILGTIRESKRATRQRRRTRLSPWSWLVAAAAALTVLVAGLAGRDPSAVHRPHESTSMAATLRAADLAPPAPMAAPVPAPSPPEIERPAPVRHPKIEFVVRTRWAPEPEIQFVVNLGSAPVVEEEDRGRADPVDGPSLYAREELLWGALATTPVTSRIIFREPEPSMRRSESEWLPPSEARHSFLVSVEIVAAQWQ